MAFKRKRVSSTRFKRRVRRKPMMKRMGSKRIPRSVPTKVFRVVRQFYAGAVAPTSVATTNFFCYVTPSLQSAGTIFGTTLGGLPNLAEYQALFDMFTLNAIKLRFVPRLADMNYEQFNSTTGVQFNERPRVAILVDGKTEFAPSGTYGLTSYNAMLEQGRVRDVRGDKPFSVYFKPYIQEQYGAGALRYIRPRPTATTTASLGPSMVHRGFYIYGYNWNFTAFSPNPQQQYDVYATYYLTFQGSR